MRQTTINGNGFWIFSLNVIKIILLFTFPDNLKKTIINKTTWHINTTGMYRMLIAVSGALSASNESPQNIIFIILFLDEETEAERC